MTLSPGRAFSAFPCEPNKIRRFSPAPRIFAWFDRRMCSRAPFVRGSGAEAPPFPARAFAGRLLPGQAHTRPSCVYRKLRPFDLVTESLNVSDDGRAAVLLIDALASPFKSKP